MNVEELFTMMVERRASHLHLVPGSPIMVRQNNVLSPLDGHVLSPNDTRAFSEAIMNEQLQEEFDANLEVNFSFSVPGLSRFRVNVFRQRGTVAAVISTVPPAPPTIEELGLPELIKNLVLRAQSGLIVICGPKQSGKSHTLAALVNYLLEMKICNIISIENPIDFLHKNKKGIICQREIGTDTQSYQKAFASLMHQSADVLVTTEIPDFEVANAILNLAAGGSLVLSTAVAPSATVMVEKLIDLFPPHLNQQARTLLSVGLEAVVSQVLLRKASGEGLVPSFEILLGTAQVKNALREGKAFQLHTIMGTAGRESGMQTMEFALRYLVKKGLVTLEEATAKAVRPEEFKKLMSLPY
jgi:twitching motility protein PilT